MQKLESYYAGVYWGMRKETTQECALRTASLLQGLAEHDSLFSKWYQKAHTLKEAKKNYIPKDNLQRIQSLFDGGKNYTDLDHHVIDELGSNIGLWAEEEEGKSASLNILCGCYSDVVINSCIIDLRDKSPKEKSILNTAKVVNILASMVTAWQPDWGVVNSYSYLSLAPKIEQQSPSVGWVTYLSDNRGSIPSLPSPARTITLNSFGNLIISTDEKFTVSNQAHVKQANSILNILYKHGLLKPMK